MAITAPTSVLSTSLVRRVINGVVVRQPDIKLNPPLLQVDLCKCRDYRD